MDWLGGLDGRTEQGHTLKEMTVSFKCSTSNPVPSTQRISFLGSTTQVWIYTRLSIILWKGGKKGNECRVGKQWSLSKSVARPELLFLDFSHFCDSPSSSCHVLLFGVCHHIAVFIYNGTRQEETRLLKRVRNGKRHSFSFVWSACGIQTC